MPTTKVKLPGGREVEIQEVLSFIYNVPRSDIEVLNVLQERGSLTTDEIAELLKTTKPSISKALNNLVKKGLITREKERDVSRKGRPTYIYKVDRKFLTEKILNDLKTLNQELENWVKGTLSN